MSQLLQIAVASRRSPSQEWRSPETVIAVTVAAASDKLNYISSILTTEKITVSPCPYSGATSPEPGNPPEAEPSTSEAGRGSGAPGAPYASWTSMRLSLSNYRGRECSHAPPDRDHRKPPTESIPIQRRHPPSLRLQAVAAQAEGEEREWKLGWGDEVERSRTDEVAISGNNNQSERELKL
nr:hypothetical protein Iba_chr02bCG23390 [Ipomoea batatas]